MCPIQRDSHRVRAALTDRIAAQGGRVVDRYGPSMEDRILIECSAKHRWVVRAWKILSDRTWCPECAIERQRLGIDAARDIARDRGGHCLSSEYRNVHTLMRWSCHLGHQFDQTVNEITQKNQWCPECRATTPKNPQPLRTFVDLLNVARSAGIMHTGNTKALHRKTSWRCNCGAEWEATGQVMLKRKNLCLACAGKAPMTIERCQDHARSLGGRCLSTEYVNNREKLHWECQSGHRWWAKWSNVGVNGTWCPSCRH